MSKAFKVEPSPFEEQRLSLIKQLFPENFLQLESIDSDSKSETLWMDELLNYVCTHLYPTFYFREDTPDGMSNHLPMVLSALFQIKSTLKSTHPPQINEEVYIKNVRSHLEKLIPINPNDQYENETLSQWEEEVYSPFIVKLKKEFSKSNLDSFIKNELSQIFNQIFTGHIHTNRPDFLIYRRYMQIFIYLHVIQFDQSKAFVGEGEILPMHLSETVFENVINHPVILKLMEGISGGAFHPIILLGYGILQHFHTVMVVTALAYQMYSYQNIEPQSELVQIEKEEKCATLLEILGRTDKLHPEYLSDGFRNDLLKKGGFLIHNMMGNAKVSIDQQEYAFQCSQIYDENGELRFSLEDFCKLALELYLRSDKMDIGTLHTVTASFAFGLVANHIREEKTKKALFGYLWQSFILVYIVIGGAKSLTLKYDSNEIPQWEEIMAHLENDVEEHDIKLVYTCGVEAKTYPKLESLYRQSAAKRLKLIQTESSKP